MLPTKKSTKQTTPPYFTNKWVVSCPQTGKRYRGGKNTSKLPVVDPTKFPPWPSWRLLPAVLASCPQHRPSHTHFRVLQAQGLLARPNTAHLCNCSGSAATLVPVSPGTPCKALHCRLPPDKMLCWVNCSSVLNIRGAPLLGSSKLYKIWTFYTGTLHLHKPPQEAWGFHLTSMFSLGLHPRPSPSKVPLSWHSPIPLQC